MTSQEPLLRVRGLRKVYPTPDGGEVVAVDDVNLTIGRNESLAVVGESGSGKTTTARIVAGLEMATSGTIEMPGRTHSGRSAASRRARARHVQMVFQDPFGSLDPRQALGACLEEVLQLHQPAAGRTARRQRTLELFEMVGLDSSHLEKKPRALSGGQRQRFAIARALAPQPELLILDEAVSALDVSVQAQILNLLGDLREQVEISYFFVSHDLAVVRQISENVLVMQGGRVMEAGRTEQVLDHPETVYTQQLLSAIPGPGWIPPRRGARL